jgi:hypothetical protein
VIAATVLDVRVRTCVRAWAPTARSSTWRAPIAAAGLAVIIVVAHLAGNPSADSGSFVPRAQLVAAVIAAAAATTLSDNAAALVETSPTPAAWRAALRLGSASTVWALSWALTLALVATAPGPTPGGALTLQAVALLSVAVGATAIRGPAAGSASVALVAFIGQLLPERWSILGGSAAANSRLGVLVVGGIVAWAWGTQDPARRTRGRPSRGRSPEVGAGGVADFVADVSPGSAPQTSVGNKGSSQGACAGAPHHIGPVASHRPEITRDRPDV